MTNQIVQKWSKQEIIVCVHYLHTYLHAYVSQWHAQSLSAGVSRISVAQHAQKIKENKHICCLWKPNSSKGC